MFRYLLQVCTFISRFKLAVRVTKNYFTALNLFGIAHAHSNDVILQFKDKEFENEVKRATTQGELYLAQLMRMLRTLILQTSVEYQECLIQQIEITRKNVQIGPIGEHWDKLTAMRVKGNRLKDELNKYEALATNIGNIVNSQASSTFLANDIVLDKLNDELQKLQKLCHEQFEEIHKYETELLIISRDSILNETGQN